MWYRQEEDQRWVLYDGDRELTWFPSRRGLRQFVAEAYPGAVVPWKPHWAAPDGARIVGAVNGLR